MCAMFAYLSTRLEISRSKKPFCSSSGADRWMYSSGVRTRAITSPVGILPVGIRRAPGTNSERKRSQFRGLFAGPEMTSYTAAIIESMVATSAGFAGGIAAGDGVAVAGGVGDGVCAETPTAKPIAKATRRSWQTRAITEDSFMN